jgi:hypothetical protein
MIQDVAMATATADTLALSDALQEVHQVPGRHARKRLSYVNPDASVRVQLMDWKRREIVGVSGGNSWWSLGKVEWRPACAFSALWGVVDVDVGADSDRSLRSARSRPHSLPCARSVSRRIMLAVYSTLLRPLPTLSSSKPPPRRRSANLRAPSHLPSPSRDRRRNSLYPTAFLSL